MTFATMHTPNGHMNGEVRSALQKELRRGKEREALYWASELDLAGYGNYVWKTLRLIATEDVGLADSSVAVVVRCLYENWLDQRKADSGDSLSTSLFLMQAVLVLARAPKSRLVDHALMVMYEGPRTPIPVPDYALDRHTGAGRKLGRGEDHFFEVGALLEHEAPVLDEYAAEGRKARTKPVSRKHIKLGGR